MRRAVSLGVGLCALSVAWAAGCHYRSGDPEPTPVGRAKREPGPPEPATALPPAPVEAPQGDLSQTLVHVVRRITVLTDSWASAGGYAVDGLHYPDSARAPHCVGNAPLYDGVGGADNSFAFLAIQIQVFFRAFTLPGDRNAQGSQAMLLRLRGVGELPAYNGLSAEVFLASGARDASGAWVPPEDWATYPWAPTPESTEVTAAGERRGKAFFPGAYLVDDELVTGVQPGTEPLRVEFGQEQLALQLLIHRPVVTLKLSPDRRTGSGIVSGILAFDELVNACRRSLHAMGTCGAAAEQWLSTPQMQYVRDVLLDGTQRAGVACDGVSIGFAFETVAATLSTELGVDTPPLAECK